MVVLQSKSLDDLIEDHKTAGERPICNHNNLESEKGLTESHIYNDISNNSGVDTLRSDLPSIKMVY